MRLTKLLLSAAIAAGLAAPSPMLADKKSDAVAAGVILGLAIKAAIDHNRNYKTQNSAPDEVFFPADLPGVSCYTRAQQCYYHGNYSARATRAVFWN